MMMRGFICWWWCDFDQIIKSIRRKERSAFASLLFGSARFLLLSYITSKIRVCFVSPVRAWRLLLLITGRISKKSLISLKKSQSKKKWTRWIRWIGFPFLLLSTWLSFLKNSTSTLFYPIQSKMQEEAQLKIV